MTTTEPRGTSQPPVAEVLADWLRDQLWADGPYGDDDSQVSDFALAYEEAWSVEDHAAPRDTAILRTPDGRFWHATITVTAVEQATRTPTQEQTWQRQRETTPDNLTDALIDEWASDDESATEDGAP